MNRLNNKPFIIDATRAHKSGVVKYLKNGTAEIVINKKTHRIPKELQYDLTQATIFGLNERLTSAAKSPLIDTKKNETLRDLFNKEWEKYQKALEEFSDSSVFDYGYYSYYLSSGALVRYCPKFWHKVVSVASSSMLVTDPKSEMSWREIRDVLENTTVVVAGGSVGNNISHSTIMDMRPNVFKIADKSMFKMENINRVRLQYYEIVAPNSKRKTPMDTLLRNKAEVLAEQVYSIDPYIDIYTYTEGITHGNIGEFLDGNKKEPKADIVLEEVDDPRTKIFIREEARRRRLPLIMATDAGSAVQLDIARYDLNPDESLTYGVPDDKLRQSTDDVYDKVGDRAVFFKFVDALIGKNYRTDELDKIINEQCEIPTSTIIPQLGSTATMAGALVSETIARIRLGHIYPKRIIMNKRTFKVKVYQ